MERTLRLPQMRLIAYKLRSTEPTRIVPSAAIAGGEDGLPVENSHFCTVEFDYAWVVVVRSDVDGAIGFTTIGEGEAKSPAVNSHFWLPSGLIAYKLPSSDPT